ncbi:CE1759 family FMN reductase [Streptomyces bauhiniae]|uniref:CE1759 family FMN reductase n=1 Tax=Streptomyces bauhiniae TaxID=2340725 RepID=UPI0035DF8EA0
MKLVVVSAGLSSPSSTRLLADRLAEATARRAGGADQKVNVQVVELRDLATDIAHHMVTGFPAARLAAALDAVAAADGLIVVTPVFSASYSGLFKSFFDVIDKDALTGTPVLLGATGGTARHSLVTENAMRPLFSYLRALVLPTAVFAASEDWGDEGLEGRVERAGAELAQFMGAAALPTVPSARTGAAPDTSASSDAPGPAVAAVRPDTDTAAAIAPRSFTGAVTSVDRPTPSPCKSCPSSSS